MIYEYIVTYEDLDNHYLSDRMAETLDEAKHIREFMERMNKMRTEHGKHPHYQNIRIYKMVEVED